MLHTSRPDRTRRLPNSHRYMGHEHLFVKPILDFGRISRLKEQLDRFDQIMPGFFDSMSLTGDV
jgi:hypothetical protein